MAVHVFNQLLAMYRIVPTIVYGAYNNVHVYSFRFIAGLNDGHMHSQLQTCVTNLGIRISYTIAWLGHIRSLCIVA